MPDNLTTVEDLIHDEEGLGVVRDAIDHFREHWSEHWSEPDATDAEALVAITRCWLHEAQSSLEFHEG